MLTIDVCSRSLRDITRAGRWKAWILIGSLVASCSGLAVAKPVAGGKADGSEKRAKLEQKRDAVDAMASMTMDRLLAENPKAKRLFDKSVGYAVFDNFKVALLISGGGGIGVAVERSTRARTYMKMGTAGIGLGVGGQSYGVVFLFEDTETFQSFVEKGWQADATATAAMWSKGSSAEASFSHGLAVYQLTNKGLMVHVDIAGTKYWKHRKLNAPVQSAELHPAPSRQPSR